MLKYLYCLLASILLVFFSQGILASFIPPERLNVLLVFLVFITFVWGLDWGFIFACLIGLFLGFYSYLPLGAHIVIFLLIIFLVDYLHRQIFINFTFTTNIILILISTLVFELVLSFLNFIFYLSGLTPIYIGWDRIFWQNLAWQIAGNLILICLVFIFAKAIFKKLNLAILVKR